MAPKTVESALREQQAALSHSVDMEIRDLLRKSEEAEAVEEEAAAAEEEAAAEEPAAEEAAPAAEEAAPAVEAAAEAAAPVDQIKKAINDAMETGKQKVEDLKKTLKNFKLEDLKAQFGGK